MYTRDVLSIIFRIYACIVEASNGNGKVGFPWVPWEFHGNKNELTVGMGMERKWEWIEWEIGNGNP